MKNKLLNLIEKYSTQIEEHNKSIDILSFSQCQHLIYKREQLKEIVNDLKKLL